VQAFGVDRLDHDVLAGLERLAVGRVRVPELAVDEDEALVPNLTGLADEPVGTDRGRHPPDLRRLGQREAE
jgi:hypothetical protein